MRTQWLRMTALLLILSLAPAAAGHQSAVGAKHDRSSCPHQSSRAAGAGASAAPAQPTGAKVTRITLPDRVGGPLFNLDRRSSAFDL